MGQRLIFLALLLSAGFARVASLEAASGEQGIRTVLKAQAEAWNRGDVDGYMNGYARGSSTVFMSGDTVTRGWQTVRNRYAKKYNSRAKMGRLFFGIEHYPAKRSRRIGRGPLEAGA